MRVRPRDRDHPRTQVQLAAAVSALQAVLRHVAAAARAAADGVLGQAPGSTPAGPVALQLLRKLAQRGVLPKLPAAAQLAGACEEAVGGGGIGPAAQAAAQLAAVLAELQVGGGGAGGAGVQCGAAQYGGVGCMRVLPAAPWVPGARAVHTVGHIAPATSPPRGALPVYVR